jgi:hypothetical protein
MNKTIGIIISLIVVVAAIFGLGVYKFKFAINDTNLVNIGATSAKDATYKINGELVTFKNGVSEIDAAPGSSAKIITRWFGNEVKHDFDGDGREDIAFLVSQETGGSGTFYYVVMALGVSRRPYCSTDNPHGQWKCCRSELCCEKPR